MQRARMHLVSGPSSAGKSRWIEAHGARFDEVLFPGALTQLVPRLGRGYALHYNVLRPFEKQRELASARSLGKRLRAWSLGRRLAGDPFATDPPLARLLALDVERSATVLVVPRADVERRMRARDMRETLVEDGVAYPREKWLAILEAVDLGAVYAAWIDWLARASIPFELVDARDERYAPLTEAELAARLEPRS